MKRVKIMLSAILVLAVVAGALAFKAKKDNGFCLYKTVSIAPNVLTCKTQGMYTTTPTLNGGITARSIFTTPTLCDQVTTALPVASCTFTLTTIAED